MRLIHILPVVVFLILGCASNDVWYLNGRSEADLRLAGKQCELQSEQSFNMGAGAHQLGYGVGSNNPYSAAAGFLDILAQSAQKSNFFDQCMERHGFKKANPQLVNSKIQGGSDVNTRMACYIDSDCARGYSCRSISGGGSECRVR